MNGSVGDPPINRKSRKKLPSPPKKTEDLASENSAEPPIIKGEQIILLKDKRQARVSCSPTEYKVETGEPGQIGNIFQFNLETRELFFNNKPATELQRSDFKRLVGGLNKKMKGG